MSGLLLVNGTSPMQHQLCRENPGALTQPVYGDLTDEAPCYIPPNLTGDGLDIFRLETLMQAMGLGLDLDSYPGSGHSLRYEGMTATLQIEYFNSWPYHGVLSNVSYIYNLIPVPKNPYKATSLVWEQYPGRRVKRDTHGILLSVQGTGQLAAFNVQQLLVTLTTSLALLAVSATVVKYLALYALKQRQYYKEYLFQVSADLSDVRDLESLAEADLNAMLRERELPTGGNRAQQILRLAEHARANEGSAVFHGNLTREGSARPH